MADTIPDILLDPETYSNIYALSSITTGTSVAVQNKTDSQVILQTILAQPTLGSTDGVIVEPWKMVVVSSGEAGLWAIGDGSIGVQEL